MTEPRDFIDERLKRLAARTEGVAPAGGFEDWILAGVERASGVVWFDSMWRSGRVALVVGALAAAASVVAAVSVQTDLDDATMTAFELVELDE